MATAIIDIDDVTLQWTKGFSKYVGKDLTVEDRTISNCLSLTERDADKIVKAFNSSEQFRHLEYIPGAKKGIARLRQDYEIVFMTSCGTGADTVLHRYASLEGVAEYGEIIFLELHELKEELIKKINPVLYIDDNYLNMMAAKRNGAESYLFDTPWARLHGPTYHWEDILHEHYK